MTKKDIGLKIKNIRLKAGLTQAKLGRKLNPGIRTETISRIEKGKYNYTIDMLFKISKALECDISDFIEPKIRNSRVFIFEGTFDELKDKIKQE